jgi:hypothetical protein
MTYPIFIMPHRHFKKRFSERGGRKWVHDFAVDAFGNLVDILDNG